MPVSARVISDALSQILHSWQGKGKGWAQLLSVSLCAQFQLSTLRGGLPFCNLQCHLPVSPQRNHLVQDLGLGSRKAECPEGLSGTQRGLSVCFFCLVHMPFE